MTMSVEAAAQALREATREVVRRYSTWYLIQGVLMVLAGIVALVYPFVSTVALVVVLGWLLILSGIVQGISLIGAQNVPNFWLQLVSVVLSIIVGVLFLRRPGEAVVTLTLLLIVFFMVEGFAKLLFSLTIRPLPNWGWVFASGIIGILLSIYLLANLTTTAVWLLGVLLGIQLIFEGVASARWRGRCVRTRKLRSDRRLRAVIRTVSPPRERGNINSCPCAVGTFERFSRLPRLAPHDFRLTDMARPAV
jgi:uncharacterized membrane protein HdeD (DUF308 family)